MARCGSINADEVAPQHSSQGLHLAPALSTTDLPPLSPDDDDDLAYDDDDLAEVETAVNTIPESDDIDPTLTF